MAIASGYPKYLGSTGSWTVSDGETGGHRVNREYTAKYLTMTTSETDNAVLVNWGLGIDIGDAFNGHGDQFDLYAICRSIESSQPNPVDEPKKWISVARFGRLGRPPDEPADPTQPWTRGAKWSISQSDYAVSCITDIDDDPVVNSAGDRFPDPIEKDKARTLIDVVYYKQTLALSTLDQYRFALNNATFWGYAQNALRINSLTAEEQYENNLYYWEIHAQVEADPTDLWQLKLLDEGMVEVVDGDRVLPQDSGSTKYVTPQVLDGSGGFLDAGASFASSWMTFDIYEELDFTAAALALPSFPTHLTY